MIIYIMIIYSIIMIIYRVRITVSWSFTVSWSSGGSRISERGGPPTFKVGAQTYYLVKFRPPPQTARKWKKLDRGRNVIFNCIMLIYFHHDHSQYHDHCPAFVETVAVPLTKSFQNQLFYMYVFANTLLSTFNKINILEHLQTVSRR